jgi:hypothetical protein
MRVLLHDFIRQEALNGLLTSKKTKKNGTVHNLLSIRNIEKDLLSPAHL